MRAAAALHSDWTGQRRSNQQQLDQSQLTALPHKTTNFAQNHVRHKQRQRALHYYCRSCMYSELSVTAESVTAGAMVGIFDLEYDVIYYIFKALFIIGTITTALFLTFFFRLDHDLLLWLHGRSNHSHYFKNKRVWITGMSPSTDCSSCNKKERYSLWCGVYFALILMVLYTLLLCRWQQWYRRVPSI